MSTEVNSIGDWKVGNTLSREAREAAISEMLENQDPGLEPRTREELEAMGDSLLWCVWLRH